VVGALAGGGCARSRPATIPTPVALNVAPPPARGISTPPEPVVPTGATTLDRPAPANRPARNSRPSVARSEPRAAEPGPTEAASDAVPAPPPEPPAASAPLLRTPQTADEQQAERRTREVLGRATALLAKVSAASLTQQARLQHETARRFVGQAEQAILERNYVLASYLADKAETLAKGLSR
jgi:hypothetical protein